MPQITLARALKLKSILVGKLSKVQSEIQINNSVTAGTEQADVKSLLLQRSEILAHILSLKTIHYKANLEIQAALYELGEAKSSLVFWNSLQTTDGDTGEVHYGTTLKVVKQAIVKTPEKNEQIAILESRIEQLQEQVDQYNFSTKIDVPDGLLAAAGVAKSRHSV